MNLEMWILMLVPLIVFVVVEIKYGATAGVVAALVLSAMVGIYWYFRFGELDEMLITEFALILALGLISLKMKDSRFFKFQPVAIGVAMAGYCWFWQISGEPILLRMASLTAPMVPEMQRLLEIPQFSVCLGENSYLLAWIFLGHAVVVGVAAVKLGSIGWLVTRLAIYPLILIPAIAVRLCLGS